MIWIVATILLIIGLVSLIAIAVALVTIVMELIVRVAFAAGLAMLIGGVGAIAAALRGADGVLVGAFAFLLAFVPALVSVWRWRSSRADKLDRRGARAQRAGKPKDASKVPIERQLGLTDADRLSAAWDKASRLASENALGKPRKACARFLKVFEAEADCDPGSVELAMFIRRHVPALVDDTRAVLHAASSQEGEGAVAGMVAALKQLGEEAAAASERRSAHARERLSLRRDHFARRYAAQGEWG